MGRDRNMLNVHALVAGIALMVADLKYNDQMAHKKLLEVLYTLVSHKQTALSQFASLENWYICYWADSDDEAEQWHRQLAQGLFNVFQDKHGSKVIPISSLCAATANQVTVTCFLFNTAHALLVAAQSHRCCLTYTKPLCNAVHCKFKSIDIAGCVCKADFHLLFLFDYPGSDV